MTKKQWNKVYLGWILGMVLPAVILFIILLSKKGDRSLVEFTQTSLKLGFLPQLISLCLIPNLLLFFTFIRLNWLRAARGVLLSMFFSGAIILLLKLL